MGKLKLTLEQLAVETFATREQAAVARGTVHARQESYFETCENWRTCYIDCTMDCTFPRWLC
jgi:hypothetical protein